MGNGDKKGQEPTQKPAVAGWAGKHGKPQAASTKDREPHYEMMDYPRFQERIAALRDPKHIQELEILFTNLKTGSINAVRVSNDEALIQRFLKAYKEGDVDTLINWSNKVTLDSNHDARVEALAAYIDGRITKDQFIEINMLVTLPRTTNFIKLEAVPLDKAAVDQSEKNDPKSNTDEDRFDPVSEQMKVYDPYLNSHKANQANKTSQFFYKLTTVRDPGKSEIDELAMTAKIATSQCIFPRSGDDKTAITWIPAYTLISSYFKSTNNSVEPIILYGECTFLQQHHFQKNNGRVLFLELPGDNRSYSFHTNEFSAIGGTFHDLLHLIIVNAIPMEYRKAILALAEGHLKLCNKSSNIETSTQVTQSAVAYEDMVTFPGFFKQTHGDNWFQGLISSFINAGKEEIGSKQDSASFYDAPDHALSLFTFLAALALSENDFKKSGCIQKPESSFISKLFKNDIEIMLQTLEIPIDEIHEQSLVDCYRSIKSDIRHLQLKHVMSGHHDAAYFAPAAVAIGLLKNKLANTEDPPYEDEAQVIKQSIAEIMESPDLVSITGSPIETQQDHVKRERVLQKGKSPSNS